MKSKSIFIKQTICDNCLFLNSNIAKYIRNTPSKISEKNDVMLKDCKINHKLNFENK